MELTTTSAELKELLKAALVEVLQERSDLISDALEDALEDRYLAKAIELARDEGLADKQAVAQLLGLTL